MVECVPTTKLPGLNSPTSTSFIYFEIKSVTRLIGRGVIIVIFPSLQSNYSQLNNKLNIKYSGIYMGGKHNESGAKLFAVKSLNSFISSLLTYLNVLYVFHCGWTSRTVLN